MADLIPDVFYKNFDALAAIDANSELISKDFEVVDWLGRLIEQLNSLFSGDGSGLSQKYNYEEVAQNINQFVTDYTAESDQFFQLQARNSQSLPKVELIIDNLLVLQERFSHNKDPEVAERVKEIFIPSIEKLIQVLPQNHVLRNLLDSNGSLSL